MINGGLQLFNGLVNNGFLQWWFNGIMIHLVLDFISIEKIARMPVPLPTVSKRNGYSILDNLK